MEFHSLLLWLDIALAVHWYQHYTEGIAVVSGSHFCLLLQCPGSVCRSAAWIRRRGPINTELSESDHPVRRSAHARRGAVRDATGEHCRPEAPKNRRCRGSRAPRDSSSQALKFQFCWTPVWLVWNKELSARHEFLVRMFRCSQDRRQVEKRANWKQPVPLHAKERPTFNIEKMDLRMWFRNVLCSLKVGFDCLRTACHGIPRVTPKLVSAELMIDLYVNHCSGAGVSLMID